MRPTDLDEAEEDDRVNVPPVVIFSLVIEGG
jgi:hypothetical protein